VKDLFNWFQGKKGSVTPKTPKEISEEGLNQASQMERTIQASARRGYLWSGLEGSINSGNATIIRHFLSRSNLVLGDVLTIKDDRQFLIQIQKMLRNRRELHHLIPSIQQIIDSLE
jgi:hypothetical protein